MWCERQRETVRNASEMMRRRSQMTSVNVRSNSTDEIEAIALSEHVMTLIAKMWCVRSLEVKTFEHAATPLS